MPQALQKNICKFTENVLFNPTNIPDELIESGCLSEDECSAIAAKPSYKDQIRMLIRKIKTRGPEKIEKFLEIVGKNHPYVQEDVIKSLESIVSESKNKPFCAICVMKSVVDLKDICDYLWQADIISENVYDDIVECDSIHMNRPILWDNIIYSINNFEDPENALDTLISALESKYKYIVDFLRETPERPSLKCSCCRKRRIRARPLWSDFGSQTDLSTTSEVPKTKLPKTIYMPEGSISDDTQSITSSQDLLSGSFRGLSYDALERYDSIGNNSDKVFSKSLEIQNPSITSTTNTVIESNDKDRSRHASGHFIPQEQSIDTGECDRSIPFFCKPSQIFDDRPEHPSFHHSLSTQDNETVVESPFTASDEATHSSSTYNGNQVQRSSQSSDGLVSPVVAQKAVGFTQNRGNDSSKESAKESDNEEPLYVRQKAYRRRRLRSSTDTVDVENHMDNQGSSHIDRARQRRVQRKRFARQKSLPKGDIDLTTNPGPKLEKTAIITDPLNPDSRTSKESMKHELQRQQSMGKIGTHNEYKSTDTDEGEEKDSQKMLSSIQNKVILQPQSPWKWHYNQEKHYLQTFQHNNSFTRRDKNFKSDTDLRTENLSDALAISDFTT